MENVAAPTEHKMGPALFTDMLRGIPLMVSGGCLTLAWIITVAFKGSITSGSTTLSYSYSKVDNAGFFFGMCILGMIAEGVFFGLYFVVGLDKLSNLRQESQGAGGTVQVMTCNWWITELSVHASLGFMLFLSSCLFASELRDAANTRQCDQSGVSCDLSGWIVAVILVLPIAVGAMGFIIYASYIELKKSGFMCFGAGNAQPAQAGQPRQAEAPQGGSNWSTGGGEKPPAPAPV